MTLTNSLVTAVARNAPALLVADEAHQILFATGNARLWLRMFFPKHSAADVLPLRISRWLGMKASSRASAGLRAKRAGAYLFIRKCVPQPGECIALLLELVKDSRDRLRRSGTLSRRQEDVLRWMAEGKSNKAIAAILRISPKTVGKHIENLFRKLGVTSRVAAANAYAAAFRSPS